MHIVLASTRVRPEVVAHLKAIGGAAVTVAGDEPALLAGMAKADALICSDHAYTPALAEALGRAPQLRWLQLLTAGYDNVGRIGVPGHLTMCNVGDAFSPAVAVHAVGLMLALQRAIPALLADQRAHTWDVNVSARMSMPDGQTMLIVGFGSIGQEIARLVRPFGMKIIGVTRSGSPDPLADEIHKTADLHRLLPRADVIVMALPLGPATTGMIGGKELALCRKSALLINIARGKIVDTAALVAALQAGTIAGAGLDVTEPEPLPAGHPLWDAPNVIIAPHIGGAAGPVGVARLSDRAGANLKRFLASEPVQHVVRR